MAGDRGHLEATAGGRLCFRRPTWEDLDLVYQIHHDPRTNMHNPAGPDPDRDSSTRRLEQWIEHWDKHGFGYSVVHTLESGANADKRGTVVGFTGVQHSTWLQRPVLNLYYRYTPEHWGRGYATEGARHVVSWARTHRRELAVLAYTTADNTGSQRTAAAAGLTRRPDLEHELNGRHAVVFVSHWHG